MTKQETYGRTKTGVELTRAVIERLAREAEEGLDVSMLRRRPGRPAMGSGPAGSLPIRLEPELRRALDDRAAAEHTTPSDVVRQALRRHLAHADANTGHVRARESVASRSSKGGSMSKGGQTSKAAAKAAGKTLGSKSASKAAKSAAGSALTQRGSNEQTSKTAAKAAGKTLGSKSASKSAKSAAGSALAQRGNRTSKR